ncbi:MAG: biotin/lipoyl-containing protein, partial [Actinomycetes bacterium]
MSDVQQFRLPDVGEGLTEAEIVSWKVKPCDAVKVNDVIVEIETAKSLVELPCPWAGTVAELLVSEGETVEVGTPIIAVTVGAKAGGAAATPASGASAPADATAATAAATSAHTSGEAPSGTPKEDLVPAIPTPGDEESVEPGLIGGPAPGGRTSVLVGYG